MNEIKVVLPPCCLKTNKYGFLNDDHRRNASGTKYLMDCYNLFNKYGLVARSTTLSILMNGKTDHHFVDKFDKKHESNINISHNSLHIYTGKIYGGYIGIDIDYGKHDINILRKKGLEIDESKFDNKPEKTLYGDAYNEYNNRLIYNNVIPHRTLTCRSPSGGVHYLYKLNDEQMEIIDEMCFAPTLGLFNQDIDVLYNKSRFHFAGCYYNQITNSECVYELTDDSEPMELPKFVFDEILTKLISLKSKETEFIKKANKYLGIKESIKNIDEIYDDLDEIKPIKIIKIKPTKKPDSSNIDKKVDNPDEIFNKISKGFHKRRVSEYSSWVKIGFSMYNMGCKFETFNEWSKTTTKGNYDKKACIKLWETAKNEKSKDKCSIGSLLVMLEDDNLRLCEKIKSELKYSKMFGKLIEISPEEQLIIRKPCDTSSAEYMYKNHRDKFIYAYAIDSWYILNDNNIWIENKEGGQISYLIKNKIIDFFISKQSEIIEKMCELSIEGKLTSDIEKSLNEDLEKMTIQRSKYTKFLSSYSKLRTSTLSLRNLWVDKEIYDRLDTVNPYLFAFKNGVFDLKTFEFRKALPEELVTKTVDYDYVPINNKISNAINDIMENFYNTIFESQEDIDTILYEIAQCLDGMNFSNSFYIYSGVGANGKGISIQLIRQTFGVYYYEMNFDYLCQAKNNNNTAPDSILAALKDKRLVFTTETPVKCKLRLDKIKDWTGGVTITTRELYKNPFTYKPNFRLFIQTNHNIDIPEARTNSMVRRMHSRHFPFKFVDKSRFNPNDKTNKLIDYNLTERFMDPVYKIAYFHILLKYYKRLHTKLNRVIPISRKFTNDSVNLFNLNDDFTPFKEAIFEITGNRKDKIFVTELFDKYNEFNRPGSLLLLSQFKEAMKESGAEEAIYEGKKVFRYVTYKDIEEENKNDLEFK